MHRRLSRSAVDAAVLSVALSACRPDTVAMQRPQDPCDAASYNEVACQQAITAHGYYWQGIWRPVFYQYPFGYYSSQYNTFIARGGTDSRQSVELYSPRSVAPAGMPASGQTSLSGSGGTVRGGFGSTAASHASGFGAGHFGG